MYAKRYIETSVKIIENYNGEIPFHLYLKKHFAANKKYGSRDRKQIASLCYNYFRLGNAAKNISTEERILFAEKLINHQHDGTTDEFIKDIFPYTGELSEGIDAGKFNLSFLIQPDLFLRIRPGNHKRVTGKLSGAGLPYKLISENCIALPNASKVDTVIELDKEAVVQDYNSQRTGEFIQLAIDNWQLTIATWDCCAASGGKSIMTYDINPKIDLTVSDKRQSILQNLHKRFAKAGIKKYKSFVADLTTANTAKSGTGEQLSTGNYDLIICDAPCSGSGTWSRTPEQLSYFKKESIEKYSSLQKKIIENIIPSIKPGGHLLYITCSVFKKENEEVVKYVQENFNLTLQRMELLKGYEMKADTLFAALFTAPAV